MCLNLAEIGEKNFRKMFVIPSTLRDILNSDKILYTNETNADVQACKIVEIKKWLIDNVSLHFA